MLSKAYISVHVEIRTSNPWETTKEMEFIANLPKVWYHKKIVYI